MRNAHCLTWNTSRNTEKLGKGKNAQYRIWNLARKLKKGGKFRNVHCRTWNLARNPRNMKNEKHTLEDLEYGENTEKRGK